VADYSLNLPEYERPPVTEVVCGVMFAPLKAMLAPHLGLLWERYRPEYSECQEVAPLSVQIEGAKVPQAQIELLETPPLPRVWFIAPSGNKLIQVQRDRFHHNWRKINPEDEYPRHEKVLELFNDRLETFVSFLAENALGKLELKQYESTYVNHIISTSGRDLVADIGKVFPDFSWRNRQGRPSGMPEGFHWKTVFALPDGAGRLHVAIRNAIRITDNQPIIFFELTARGFGKEPTLEDMRSWFVTAHTQIVRTFDDLVDEEFQRTIWGRKS
jgi:uncharacterized protein (TIGR04255 family)